MELVVQKIDGNICELQRRGKGQKAGEPSECMCEEEGEGRKVR